MAVKRGIEVHIGKTIQVLQGDSLNSNMTKLVVEECRRTGTHPQFSQPGDKQQNGFIEANTKSLKQGATAMETFAGTTAYKPSRILAVEYRALLHNHFVRKRADSSYSSNAELWFKKPMSGFRKLILTYGCYVQCLHNKVGKEKKERTYPGIFFGFHKNLKSAIVLNLEKRIFVTCRSLRADETCFPFKVNSEPRYDISGLLKQPPEEAGYGESNDDEQTDEDQDDEEEDDGLEEMEEDEEQEEMSDEMSETSGEESDNNMDIYNKGQEDIREGEYTNNGSLGKGFLSQDLPRREEVRNKKVRFGDQVSTEHTLIEEDPLQVRELTEAVEDKYQSPQLIDMPRGRLSNTRDGIDEANIISGGRRDKKKLRTKSTIPDCNMVRKRFQGPQVRDVYHVTAKGRKKMPKSNKKANQSVQ